jgi:RNA polymerase sigma-70 factor, ECF subfamily
LTEINLIQNCIEGDRQAHSRLYSKFAPKMFVVCLRYSKNREEAEEILQEGFLKVFQFLHQFRDEGSLEGWIRKIIVNCALQRLRNNSRLAPVVNIGSYDEHFVIQDHIESTITSKELLRMVMSLPPVYKLVFNLYVFDGYKHREIANILGISEGTSKSNLYDAKIFLKKQLCKNQIIAKPYTL